MRAVRRCRGGSELYTFNRDNDDRGLNDLVSDHGNWYVIGVRGIDETVLICKETEEEATKECERFSAMLEGYDRVYVSKCLFTSKGVFIDGRGHEKYTFERCSSCNKKRRTSTMAYGICKRCRKEASGGGKDTHEGSSKGNARVPKGGKKTIRRSPSKAATARTSLHAGRGAGADTAIR